jgi:hypothetical protein
MANNMLDLGSLLEIQKNLVVSAPTDENDINRINGVLSNLNSLSDSADQGINDIRKIITRQEEIQQIVDTEKTVLDHNKQALADKVASQKREIELTDNHRKRIAEYNKIVMIIILALCALIFVNILKSKITMLPEIIFDILTIIILSYAIIWGLTRYFDIRSRSLTNFDELAFNPPAIESSAEIKQKQMAATKAGNLLGSVATTGCVGKMCCDTGTVWDTVKLRCVEAFNTLATETILMKPYAPSEFDQYGPAM